MKLLLLSFSLLMLSVTGALAKDAPEKEAPSASSPPKVTYKAPQPKIRETETRKERILAIEDGASDAARARKDRSEAVLMAEDVPINKKLPPIVDAEQAQPRSHEAVVRRTLAVLVSAVKGEGLEQEVIDQLVIEFDVADDLSPEERLFIYTSNPTSFEKIQFAWRYEAAWAMLWALSAVDTLDPPREIVEIRQMAEIVRGESVVTLMAKTKLRPIEEILDEADLIYRYRWALVDARINERDPPADLDPGVALERHRALNWLIGYLGQEWDAVTPDT